MRRKRAREPVRWSNWPAWQSCSDDWIQQLFACKEKARVFFSDIPPAASSLSRLTSPPSSVPHATVTGPPSASHGWLAAAVSHRRLPHQHTTARHLPPFQHCRPHPRYVRRNCQRPWADRYSRRFSLDDDAEDGGRGAAALSDVRRRTQTTSTGLQQQSTTAHHWRAEPLASIAWPSVCATDRCRRHTPLLGRVGGDGRTGLPRGVPDRGPSRNLALLHLADNSSLLR
jgi:hypothetical protein